MENQSQPIAAKRVLIGTPAHTGTVDVWYAHSLLETTKLCMASGIELHTVFMAYDSLLPRARNDLVKLALDANFDALIFIDADQAWEAEWILKLLSYPVDVVGGAVIKKTDEAELYNVKANLPLVVNEATGLIPVISLGTGFLKLSRAALQALYDISEEYSNEGKVNRMVFEIQVINGQLVSEDVAMCLKLDTLGLTVWLDPNMTCSHIGPKMWKGDFAKRYQQLSKDAE